MAEVVRLKRWDHRLEDGKSSVGYKTLNNKEVAVFLHLGYEPLDLTHVPEDQIVNVDDIILKLATAIRKSRKDKKAANKPNVPS